MALPWIVKGDTTTHGGEVLDGKATYTVDGKRIALVGHMVSCPKCTGRPFPIISGAPNHKVHGRSAARHGDETACGARLVSSQVRSTWSSEGLPSSGGGLAVAEPSPPFKLYDDRFILRDADTGEPLAKVEYAIERANGAIEHGTTDAAGHTHLLSKELDAENVAIYVVGAV